MRNPGWAGAALIGRGPGVHGGAGPARAVRAGGAYGYGQARPPQAPATSASPSSIMTAALTTETTPAGMILANQPRADPVLLQRGQAAQRHVGLHRWLRHPPGRRWPPRSRPPAGNPPARPARMITRPGGVRQVTINGFPIYLYAGDKDPRARDTGNGVQGSWHIIKIHTTTRRSDRPGQGPEGHPHPEARDGPGQQSRALTLYYYSADKAAQRHVGPAPASAPRPGPPLAAPVKAPAGARPARPARRHHPGRTAVKQVTLNGYPLYFYTGDKAPGPGQRQRRRRLLGTSSRSRPADVPPRNNRLYGWLSWAGAVSVSSRVHGP